MEKRLFGFARKPAPEFCPDCGNKLGPIQYGPTYERYVKTSPKLVDGCTTWRFCNCGCFIRWSWLNSRGGQGWKRHHVMPLFDDGAVIQVTDDR